MRPHLVVAAVALVVATGCPEEKPPDGREFITAIFNASVVCQPTFLAEAEPAFLDAQSQAQIDIAIDTFNRDLDNDKVTFERKSYDDCLAGAVANDCDTINAANGPCASVFQGKVEGGDVCAESVECAAGLSCFQERDTCGVCAAIAITGTSCAEANCSGSDFCNDASICQEKPQPASFDEGDACNQAQGCGGILSGLACASGNVCTAINVVGEGAACSLLPSSTEYCADSSSTRSCLDDVCTARPGLGEACNALGVCDAREAACIEGQCVDVGVDGDDCVDGRSCKLGFACRENVCRPLALASLPPTCD